MEFNELSMVDTAYELMRKMDAPINFYDLWEKVAEIKNLTEEEREDNESRFYTNITLDGRMITVGENCWDLRSRHRFEEVHIDMNDIYSDDEEDTHQDDDDGSIEDNYNE